jgi:hypothetical protein
MRGNPSSSAPLCPPGRRDSGAGARPRPASDPRAERRITRKKKARFFRRPAAGSRGRHREAGQRSGSRPARKGDVPPGPPSTGTAPLRCGCVSREARSNSMQWGSDPGWRGRALRARRPHLIAGSRSFPVNTLLYDADCTMGGCGRPRRGSRFGLPALLDEAILRFAPEDVAVFDLGPDTVEGILAFAGG